MSPTPKTLINLCLLTLLGLRMAAYGEIHKATLSPSGHFVLGSEPSYQTLPDGSRHAIGSIVSLTGADGALISKCYRPADAYPDVLPEVRGSDDWQIKAFWNKAETMIAVFSGGRTWSRIDFYSVVRNQLAVLPRANWQILLFKDLKGYQENTRLYEHFGRWAADGTFEMSVDGTAVLDDLQPERYPQFQYRVTGRISVEGIEILKIGKNSR